MSIRILLLFLIVFVFSVNLQAAPTPYRALFFYQPVTKVGKQFLPEVRKSAALAAYLNPIFEALEYESKKALSKKEYHRARVFIETWAASYAKYYDKRIQVRLTQLLSGFYGKAAIDRLSSENESLGIGEDNINKLSPFSLEYVPPEVVFQKHILQSKSAYMKSRWSILCKSPIETRRQVGRLLVFIGKVAPKPTKTESKVAALGFDARTIVEKWAIQFAGKKLQPSHQFHENRMRQLLSQSGTMKQRVEQYSNLYRILFESFPKQMPKIP